MKINLQQLKVTELCYRYILPNISLISQGYIRKWKTKVFHTCEKYSTIKVP